MAPPPQKRGSKTSFSSTLYYSQQTPIYLSLSFIITDFSPQHFLPPHHHKSPREREREREREMASEREKDGNKTTASLPLFSLPTLRNLKHSGNLNSPLHTLASVPFRWEEQPGKPLSSNALVLPSIPKCLDLPPRLLFNDAKLITQTPSPTTVLEGPYNAIGRSISFSFLRKGQVSSDGAPEEGGFLGTMILNDRNCRKDKGLLGSWRRKTRGSTLKNSSAESEVHEGNIVCPSVSDDGTGSGDGEATMVMATVTGKRGALGLSQAKSHFWATIYGTFKQAIPRRSTKWKKEAR